MDLTFYGNDDKGLIKLDPRTKLLIFLASGLMSLNSYSDLSMFIYSLLICTVYALSGRPKTALKAVVMFGVILYLRAMLDTSKGAPGVVMLIISVLTTIFLFAFPVIMSIMLLIQTTRISQFISAFSAMRLPVKVVVPLAVFFRFLPTVADEWNGIRKAMAFRGISLSPAEVITHPARTIEYVLIPLLFSSISVMEELAAAALARGMDVDTKRSAYEEVKLRAADYIIMAVFLGVIVLAVIVNMKARRGELL